MSSVVFFFFSSRRRHTRLVSDWSSDVCSSDLVAVTADPARLEDLRDALAGSGVEAAAGQAAMIEADRKSVV